MWLSNSIIVVLQNFPMYSQAIDFLLGYTHRDYEDCTYIFFKQWIRSSEYDRNYFLSSPKYG